MDQNKAQSTKKSVENVWKFRSVFVFVGTEYEALASDFNSAKWNPIYWIENTAGTMRGLYREK